ncbi:MAG TPA: contractile injection system tape measure protein [Flavisolibacter sp.]|nr:contractile injection system tape measure protein [Flavisolibacter sp.]
MNHIIKIQVLDLLVDRELNAFGVQQEISAFYWDYIVSVIENVFTELSNEDEVIIVDRLEIDLGTFSEIALRHRDERERLLLVITAQLYEKIRLGSETARQMKRRPQILNVFHQWIFYMEHGCLPWNVAATSAGWYQQVLESIASEYESAQALRELIIHKQDARNRIIWQHDEIFLTHIVELLTARNHSELVRYISELLRMHVLAAEKANQPAAIQGRDFETSIWQKVLVLAAGSPGTLTSSEIIEYLLTILFANNQLREMVRVRNVMDQLPLLYPLLMKPAQKRKSTEENGLKADQPGESIDAATPQGPAEIDRSPLIIGNTEEEKLIRPENIIAEKKEEDGPPASSIETIEEGTYQLNSGLVLLHPFIVPFFHNLGLLAAGKFIDVQHRQKALYLLHYLATGRTAAEEHELVIAKILCAYPLHEPVDGRLQLKSDELKEGDLLLEEVVAQWQILKNTSPAGLREGFLQRNGKLFSKQEHLCLQLETSSIDVLLDYLPWNLSVVKLPWMKKHLTIEWR